MKTEEYQRLIRTLNDVHESDEAVVVTIMRGNKEITVATFGDLRELQQLKLWMQDWLGTFQKGGRK